MYCQHKSYCRPAHHTRRVRKAFILPAQDRDLMLVTMTDKELYGVVSKRNLWSLPFLQHRF
jgi:hypothetical protein